MRYYPRSICDLCKLHRTRKHLFSWTFFHSNPRAFLAQKAMIIDLIMSNKSTGCFFRRFPLWNGKAKRDDST